jgi:hypothetical protein
VSCLLLFQNLKSQCAKTFLLASYLLVDFCLVELMFSFVGIALSDMENDNQKENSPDKICFVENITVLFM